MYTTCISLVYHVYITTSKQRKLSSIYEFSDNSFVISIHKEKPQKFNISRTFHILYYLRNSKLANTLSQHGIYNLLKSGNICTCNVVCLSANGCIVSLCSI